MTDPRLQIGEAEPEAIGDPAMRGLLAWWERARGDRPQPSRADLRPEEFPPRAIPCLALIESGAEQPDRLRIRLAGEEIRNPRLGYVAGALVGDVTPAWYGRQLADEYREALDSGRARFQYITSTADYGGYTYERLMLPLGDDTGRCNHLLVMTILSGKLRYFMLAGGGGTGALP